MTGPTSSPDLTPNDHQPATVSASEQPVTSIDSVHADMTETPNIEASDVERLRSFILATETEIVPELIAGETVSDILTSVEVARAAFQRVREHIPITSSERIEMATRPVTTIHLQGTASGAGSPGALPTVPAGGALPFAVDPNRLPASEKIRRGLHRRDS